MAPKKITSLLSSQRFSRYVHACNNDFQKAIILYKHNLKVAQSFHPILGIFEVVLRNKLDTVLVDHFDDHSWIITQKKGFMSDKSLTYKNGRGVIVTNTFLKKSIESSEDRLKGVNGFVSVDKLIADQPLGFWNSLFEVSHYRLLKGKPIKIFHKLPPGHGRLEVHEKLTKIRLLRNRINHNEPLCFVNKAIDFSFAEQVYEHLMELFNWMDPEIVDWIHDIDTVHISIRNVKAEFKL